MVMFFRRLWYSPLTTFRAIHAGLVEPVLLENPLKLQFDVHFALPESC
jgi:hypothetical protein